MLNIAHELVTLALMPDAHIGIGAAVGSVIPTLGAVMPAAVGVDIGCGMTAVKTQFAASDLPSERRPIRERIERAIPLLIFLIMGPLEVLVPFVIKDVAGGGPQDHALILAAFGIGGAVGSMVVASLKLPRRYLTVMNLLWAFGCLPLTVFGLTDQIWVMALAAFLVGAAFNGGVVIWGTLLQRRVPAAMLGRVSSLDFFVSLAFMPVSMAFAGPAGESLGLPVDRAVRPRRAGVAPRAGAGARACDRDVGGRRGRPLAGLRLRLVLRRSSRRSPLPRRGRSR